MVSASPASFTLQGNGDAHGDMEVSDEPGVLGLRQRGPGVTSVQEASRMCDS